MGIMEKNMETTIIGYVGFRVQRLDRLSLSKSNNEMQRPGQSPADYCSNLLARP